MQETLLKYFPPEVAPLVESIIKENKIHFTISPNRKSKAGDYRSPRNGSGHRISVNGSLNKYAFTITFFHEYAHLLVWENYGSKADPHGNQWKTIFSKILQKLIDNNIFKGSLAAAVKSYSLSPKASTDSDIFLARELKSYDKKSDFLKPLFEIDQGYKFKLENGRIFVKGEMKRTKIWCKEYGTNSIFAFNPNAEVIEL
ncbi:MAG: SprT-like domain-containing protein [Bacteroidota bacterium]